MTINTTKEEIKEFSSKNKLGILITAFIHDFDKDISEEDENKLKDLVIGFNGALRMFGIDNVYNNPELIKSEMDFQDSIFIHKKKILDKDIKDDRGREKISR